MVKGKGKGKGNYLTSVAKQAKTAFLHGPTVWKSPCYEKLVYTVRHLIDQCTSISWSSLTEKWRAQLIESPEIVYAFASDFATMAWGQVSHQKVSKRVRIWWTSD